MEFILLLIGWLGTIFQSLTGNILIWKLEHESDWNFNKNVPAYHNYPNFCAVSNSKCKNNFCTWVYHLLQCISRRDVSNNGHRPALSSTVSGHTVERHPRIINYLKSALIMYNYQTLRWCMTMNNSTHTHLKWYRLNALISWASGSK